VKKISISSILGVIAILVLVTTALAEGAALPGSGWWSGEQIQNVGSDVANITVTAYDPTGAVVGTKLDTVDPGASKTYNPIDLALPDNFQGSAIVTASQDIRAIVNVTNRYVASLGLGDPNTPSSGAAQYQGMNIPATTVNFPLVKNNHYGKTTSFYIQNAGTAATTVTATFILWKPSTSANVTYTWTGPTTPLAAGAMVVIVPDMARDGSNQPPESGNSVVGSLTVTSTEALAGVCLEHKTAETNATVLQATRAFTSNDYDTVVYIPTNKYKYYGRFTGVQVQNVSGGNIDVTINYAAQVNAGTGCPGGAFSDTKNTLGDNASWTFPSTVLPAGCFASAKINATGNVVVVINESYTADYLAANPTVYQQSTSYGALPSHLGTTIVSLPLYKENSYAKGTGISLQNISSTDAVNVIVTFKGPTGTYISMPQTIPANTAIILSDVRKKAAAFWNGTPMTDAALGGCLINTTGCGANGVFGVIITADQNIVAIANESTYPFTTPLIKQDKNNYEGFNLVTAPGY